MALNGIDIASYQAGINLAVVPCDFVIIKATQGTTYVNHDCDRAYQQAKAAGKLLGVYHYASGGGAAAEAQHFLNHIAGYIGEAILVLDWESGENAAWGYGVSYVKTFLDYIKNKTGIAPLVYMSKSVCRQYDWSSVASDYGLWAAQYANNSRTGYLSDPWTDRHGWGAWSSPVIYQYSSKGNLSGWGGNLDLDIAYMDANAWRQYAGTSYAKVGWVKDAKGWWYRHPNGTYPKSEWMKEGNNWYYFNAEGYAVSSGWQKIKEKWYYFDEHCHMMTNWIKSNGYWYYLKPDGDMATGLIELSEKYYYLNDTPSKQLPEGAMLKGLHEVDHHIYYFDNDGVMQHSIEISVRTKLTRQNGNFYKLEGRWD